VGVRAAAAAIALTLLVCVVAIGGSEPLRGSTEEVAETPQRAPEVPVAPPAEFPVPGALPPEVFVIEADEGFALPAWLIWPAVAIGLAALLVALVVLVRALGGVGIPWRRRREQPDPEPDVDEATGAVSDSEDTEVAHRALEAALVPLRDPSDPRGAVIAAYARMESVLAERELGRHAPEAPREYLARVLGEHGMPELSLTTLTEMFEEARFSRHPIPDSAPRRALGELERARAALAARDG
jgi:Domain of unknown function (DUF4129)